MLTVLRQEWNARKYNIAFAAAVIFVLVGICIPIGIAHTDTEISEFGNGFFTFLLVFSSVCAFAGILLYPLFRGAGNIGRQLLSDTGALLLTLPKRAYIILGGKMLVGLAEFLIYAVPAFFYLTLAAPLAASDTEPYVSVVKRIYYQVFVVSVGETVNIFFFTVVFFLVAQTVLNFAAVVYCSFVKNRKAAFLIFIFICTAVFVMVKAAAAVLTFLPFGRYGADSYKTLWLYAVIYGLFGILYFIITSWLFEHKVEV